MAINQTFPALDGIVPSWCDIIVRATPAGGQLVDVADIKSINTGTSMEIGEQRGASGGRVIKRTAGSESSEASMTLYYDGYVNFLRKLKGLAPIRGNERALSYVHFGIQVQFTPFGSEEIFEFRIKGCRFTGRAINAAEGTDAQTVDVALSAAKIVDVIDGEEVSLL